MFMLIVVLLVVGGLWLFNIHARNLINAGVMNTTAWIVNHIPAVSTIVLILGVIVLLPILLGASWIWIWTSIGNYAMSPIAGWIIGIGSLVGIFFLRKVVKPLILIAILVIVFGLCFPILKGSINRYGKAQEIQSANELDLKTLQMQPQGVADGVVNEKATLHDDSGKPTAAVAEVGKLLKTVSLEKRQFAGNPETFVKIMLQNINGDFLGGSVGWIPVRKVDWGVTKLDAAPPPPPPVEKVEWRLKITVPEEHRNEKNFFSGDYPASVKKTGEDWTISLFSGAEICTYAGKMKDGMIEGTWSQASPQSSGSFSLNSNADGKSFSGKSSGNDAPEKKYDLVLYQVGKKIKRKEKKERANFSFIEIRLL